MKTTNGRTLAAQATVALAREGSPGDSSIHPTPCTEQKAVRRPLSIRLWAIWICLVAVVIMFRPNTAEADGYVPLQTQVTCRS
jgi:hypothetical protein